MHKIPEMLQAYKDGLAEGGFNYSPDQVLLSRLTHIEATRARAWEVAGPPYNWFRKMLAEVAPAPGNVRRNANPLPPQLTGAVGSDPNDPGIMFCTPDECAECIEQVDAMGVGQVIFQQNWGGMPQEDVLRSLRLLATEVMPSFSATRV
jgi:alkanesulfonate monooxygenase SsuD/methylene tetrahydromethanopterin reductase-like flavin-dependent oxidoreductase (luciferase family)